MSVQEKLDTLLKSSIPSNGVPGAVVLALSRDGSTIYEGVAGTRGMEDSKEMTSDTVFWLASVTKVFTSICAMKIVEEGLIGLDDDVLSHLPELAGRQVRQDFFTPEFKLVPRDPSKKVTLRGLLSLTAGTSYPVLESIMSQIASIPTGTEPFMKADESVFVGDFECQPGTKWSYSAAFDWTGILIERLSGLSLGEYLSTKILEPCGLKSSDLTFTPTPTQKSALAASHFRWPDGRVTPRGKYFSEDVKVHLGGMGLYGTARATTEVLLILINGGMHPRTKSQILSPSTITQMFTPQLTPAQLAHLDSPTPANNMQVLFPGVAKQWGLGFLLFPEGMEHGRGKNVGSWAGFPNTHWMVDGEKGLVMVVYSQIIPQEDPKLIALKEEMEKIIYDGMKK